MWRAAPGTMPASTIKSTFTLSSTCAKRNGARRDGAQRDGTMTRRHPPIRNGKLFTMNELEHQLDYPFADTLPEAGAVHEVAPGVYWVRMPLPFALDHIN